MREIKARLSAEGKQISDQRLSAWFGRKIAEGTYRTGKALRPNRNGVLHPEWVYWIEETGGILEHESLEHESLEHESLEHETRERTRKPRKAIVRADRA